jgi:hypothetical protein
MDKRNDARKPGAAVGAEPDQEDDSKQRVALLRRRSAIAYNRAHRERVAAFNRLTRCGEGDSVDVARVREWQRAHGLGADGKVGPTTLAAAQGGGDFFEGEGVADGETLENPDFDDHLLEGARQETHEIHTEDLKGAGETVEQANEASGLTGGPEVESPWLKAAMAPAILELLREGDYAGAVKTLAAQFSPSQVLEGLTLACEKLGLHEAVKALEELAPLGAAASVGLEMVLFSYDGLVSIGEAHESGDRDARIALYAAAFADCFLFGEEAGESSGAAGEEQREAVERGRKDGTVTAARTGELAPVIGKALLKKYGSERHARQAIVDELLRRAGMKGVRL